jgi:hypothetical protein
MRRAPSAGCRGARDNGHARVNSLTHTTVGLACATPLSQQVPVKHTLFQVCLLLTPESGEAAPWPLALLFDEDFVAAPADFG